jgi:hypothetical protein
MRESSLRNCWLAIHVSWNGGSFALQWHRLSALHFHVKHIANAIVCTGHTSAKVRPEIETGGAKILHLPRKPYEDDPLTALWRPG